MPFLSKDCKLNVKSSEIADAQASWKKLAKLKDILNKLHVQSI